MIDYYCYRVLMTIVWIVVGDEDDADDYDW